MGREIKFRAWNPETKQMVYELHGINVGSGVTAEITNGALVVEYQRDRNWLMANVMQFTGLKDKNGTEIYEGDIVESDPDFFDSPVRGRIVYSEMHAGFNVKYKEHMSHYKLHPHVDSPVPWIVIGNIYEHPELLNANTVSK